MEARERAERLHKKVNTFILTCVGSDGYPMTKAVVPGKHRESLGELYFCTNTSSRFAAEISKNPKSSVYFFSRKIVWYKGCLLKGHMEIVADMDIKKKYWQGIFKDAYPQKSFTDPDFCVLKFIPTSGRFYADFTITDFEI
ncbi:MAG: pyridoxamine 5'-phosphate oxidase family protein [Treponema sp.]|nr:pyridoxamine 5'-phosphate oxidase family protein [Treponema sp.]